MMGKIIPSQEALQLIPLPMANKMNVLPIKIEDGVFHVGATEPVDRTVINNIMFYTGLKVSITPLSLEYIQQSIRSLMDPDSAQLTPTSSSNESYISDFSIIEYVDQLIREAIKCSASDIHFEVYEDLFRVRFRVDGRLSEASNISPLKSAQVISRIKILANLDISERRRPQDGRIKFQNGGYIIDIRVSCLPTSYGEKIVLRILDRNQLRLDFNSLGLREDQQIVLKKYLAFPFGMILVTGPTGSGKTTTLYSALQQIHSMEKNILTIEDPIEYNLPGINQSAVKPDIGFTFAGALRAFLRQDPDIIMVGEIRDKDTAEIAIRAALTGHLVLSTLHTNDSVSAVIRLIDMGIEPYLVASAVKLVIAQRLVRTLCKCKLKDEKEPEELIYVANGCPECKYTGYRGRTALHEFFEINEEIAELITKNASLPTIRKKAVEYGFKGLKEIGILKVKSGTTTHEEVLRETLL